MGLSRLAPLFFALTLIGCTPAPPVHRPFDRRTALPANSFDSQERHHFSQLRTLALQVLEEGAHSRDWESQLMTVFGAASSGSRDCIPMLLRIIDRGAAPVQIAAVNTLATWQEDLADQLLRRSMGSAFLIARLEAAYHLAMMKHPQAADQINSLMAKVDPELHPLFPKLYGLLGNYDALQQLRRLLIHPNRSVRIQAILNSARFGRDDLLPTLRRLMKQVGVEQQEAVAVAIGVLGDETSIPWLETMAQSKEAHVALASQSTLYKLGRVEYAQGIKELALKGNLFAIYKLGSINGSEETLLNLTQHNDRSVRANAAFALLEKRDRRAIKPASEFLLRDSRDLALQPTTSPGGAFKAIRVISSATAKAKETPYLLELSLQQREQILIRLADYHEESFLSLAHMILESGQRELVSLTISLLENHRTPETIVLLEHHQAILGNSLVRWNCNLALFRMGEEGPYASNLLWWLQQQQEEQIELRPLLPVQLREEANSPGLTPSERSRLLIESYTALAQKQSREGIEALVTAIETGHPTNRYALAGLLLRTLQ